MKSIAIVYFPWVSYSPYKFISEVLKILGPITNKNILIGSHFERIIFNPKKVDIVDIKIRIHHITDYPIIISVPLWIFKCFMIQVVTSVKIIKARKKIDILIFYMAYPYYLLPLIISKVIGIKTLEILTRSRPRSLTSKCISMIDPIFFRLLDRISPESTVIIKELGLEKYNSKIMSEGFRFIDTSRFKIIKKLDERKNIIGFIGRIKKDKGIIEFVRSIPFIIEKIKDVEFLIGGNGDMLNWVKLECKKIENLYGAKIRILGFIDEEELPKYFNELKLFVLPTMHSEGIPTTVLESMACGTPVLITSIEWVRQFNDEGTIFIIKNNLPGCIAENVIKVLKSKSLQNIIERNSEIILNKYDYRNSIIRYKDIIEL